MTATTENAPSLSGNSAAEGNDQNPRKEPIMTSVPPATDIFEAWREALTTAIEAEKERHRSDLELMKLSPRQGERWTLDDRFAKAITSNLPDLPAPPKPEWAESYEVFVESYCEISMTYSTKPVTSGLFTGRAEQAWWINFSTGEIDLLEPHVSIDSDSLVERTMPLGTAHHLAIVLLECQRMVEVTK